MEIKKQAKQLKKILEKTDPEIKLHHVYELLAKQAGYKDWNTYSIKLKQQREATQRHRKLKEQK